MAVAVVRRVFATCRNPLTGVYNDAWYEFNDVTDRITGIGVVSYELATHTSKIRLSVSTEAHSNFACYFKRITGVVEKVTIAKHDDASVNLQTKNFSMRRWTDRRGKSMVTFDGSISFNWNWGKS